MTVHPLVTAEPGTRAYYAQIAAAARAVSRAARRVPAPPASPSRPPTAPGTKRCSGCGRVLPLSEFRTKADPRCSRPGTSSDCNTCHKAYNASLRRRDAEAKGKRYRTREDIAADQASRAAAHLAAVQARRSARRAARAARPKKSSAALYRERYHSDPAFYAKERARLWENKRRRRAAELGAGRVERIHVRDVAVRDGWRCAICGKKVTRKTWSIDHIVPLSTGGEHTFRNVTLAHKRCNSRRGAGRTPVQAPLFARGVA